MGRVPLKALNFSKSRSQAVCMYNCCGFTLHWARKNPWVIWNSLPPLPPPQPSLHPIPSHPYFTHIESFCTEGSSSEVCCLQTQQPYHNLPGVVFEWSKVATFSRGSDPLQLLDSLAPQGSMQRWDHQRWPFFAESNDNTTLSVNPGLPIPNDF